MVYYSSLLQVRGDFINNKEGGLNLEFGILDLKGNLHNNTGIYTGSDMYTQFTRQEGWQQIYTESPATVKFENLGIYIQGANQYDVFVHTNDGNGYYIKDAANALAEHCYNFGCSGNSCDDCKAKQRKKIWTNLYWPANLPKFPDALENELEIPEMPEMPEMPEIPTVEDLKTRYFGFNGVYSPTGNYSTSFTDMTVPTILGDLTFTRTYNSLDYKISNVGKGFTFSYDMKMEFLKDTISIIMPNGSRSNFKLENGEYTALDSRGRLYSDDDGYILETLDQMRYGFDSSGHIKYAEDCKGNRITIVTDANDGRILSISDPTGASVSFEYADGKLIGITDNKSGRTVTYHYNGDLMDYSYDSSRLKTTYSYTQDGFLEEVWDNTGRRLLYLTYDNTVPFGGKIHEVTDVTGNQFTYTYDEINMQTTITDRNGRSTVQGYGYDLNNRLICETKDGLTISYSYDNNGNMLGKSDGTSVVTQTFDVLNRMTAYTDGETTASYTYNPDNMRRSKTVTGVKTEHIWVGSEIVLDITGNSVVSYMNGIKSNYGWYVYNAHGDVVQLCDDNGVVTKSYDYDPYGNQLTEVDALDKNPYRYSGEYYDAESGYIYLRARYYDSTTGRFISEDPAFDGFNWYDYCGGNPLNRWDPSGQAWYDWVPGIAAVTVGTVMCATGFGTPIGIGLITGGASDLLSSTLGAAGFDSKFVSMATAGMDVVVGATLLLTPFAPVGAGMVGSGFGSLAGGAISESLGGSYELGAAIGNIVGGAMGSSVYNKLTLKAGSVELMNSNDQFLINARKRKDVDPNGVLDIVAHGDPYHIYMDNNIPMDPSEAAKMIRNMPEFHGQDIRLLSCNTGSLENGIAQQLANSLNVKVTAPNKYLWADIYGNLSIYGSRNGRCANCFDPGEWIEFLPIYK